MEKRVIPVLEMSCAVCAATVEKTVRELAGVEEASVNFSANTLQVVYDPDKISLKDMQAAVSAAGYDLVISENAEADAIDAEHRLYLDLRRRTIGAWSFGLPVMVLSMIFHSPSQILTWILLALTLPVLYWGRSFYVSGWKAVKRGRANMDTLVMLSTAVSFLFSLFSTIYPHFWLSLGLVPHVYYEAVAMIIAFVLSGKLLEARAKQSTSASIRSLMGLQPKTARLVVGEISDIYVDGYRRIVTDTNFSVEELAAIAIGYKRIIEEAAGELKDLGEIINPTDMSLTDKDRIDVVERVYGTLMRHRRLAGYFTRRCISVSLLRARTHRDMERVVALYGTDEQRYW